MSGGLPVVRVTVPSPVPVIRVPVPTLPAVVRVQSQGPQGPAGQPGPQGPVGTAKGFGTVDYTDNDAVVFDANGTIIGGTPTRLEAGQWVRITRNLTSSAANFNLPSGPWANFTFWDNATKMLRARQQGDVLIFKFSYVVIPDQRNGGLRFSVRPNDSAEFEFGPDPISLVADAGTMQPGSETFIQQCRSRFVASGASIYILATAGATLLQFSPEVTPHDFALASTPVTPPSTDPTPSTVGALDFSLAGSSGLLAALCPGAPAAPSVAAAGLDLSAPSNSGLIAAIGA